MFCIEFVAYAHFTFLSSKSWHFLLIDDENCFNEILFSRLQSMNEVLGRLSTNGQTSNAIEYNGDTLVERLNQAQTTNKLKSSESFKQMKDERDQAINQVI